LKGKKLLKNMRTNPEPSRRSRPSTSRRRSMLCGSDSEAIRERPVWASDPKTLDLALLSDRDSWTLLQWR